MIHPRWTIDGEILMAMLHEVHNGEDPDMVYAEFYANAKITNPKDDEK